jgi:hypothetical protein
MSNARELSQVPNQSLSFKNRIINGAMGIWQRGTSTSTNGAYIADRFAVFSDSGTITGSRSTDVPSTNFQYSLSVSGTNYPQTWQRIESLNSYDLIGKTITISFWLKQTSGAGSNSIGIQVMHASAVDNFSTRTQIQTTNISATSSWAFYTVTVANLPAGTSNGLHILFYGNTSGSATFLITGVQLEVGSTATSFDYRPYGTELMLCQRYYQSFTVSSDWGNSSGYGMAAGTYLTEMRAAPTATYTPSSGTILSTNITSRSYQFQIQSLSSASASIATATFSIEL